MNLRRVTNLELTGKGRERRPTGASSQSFEYVEELLL
jgi:hypothetical protein